MLEGRQTAVVFQVLIHPRALAALPQMLASVGHNRLSPKSPVQLQQVIEAPRRRGRAKSMARQGVEECLRLVPRCMRQIALAR